MLVGDATVVLVAINFLEEFVCFLFNFVPLIISQLSFAVAVLVDITYSIN